MNNRVVITGLGIVAPNGVGINNFLDSIKKGKSGIVHIPELETNNFACQVGGIPNFKDEEYSELLSYYELTEADSSIKYAVIAGLEAWKDAKLQVPDLNDNSYNPAYGTIIGTCYGGIEMFTRKIFPFVNSGKTKQLGSQSVEHWMPSGSSAALSKMLALGNISTSNSSACSTSTESIILAYERIKSGKAKIIIAGGTDPYSPYAWAGFDSMRLLARTSNKEPEKASRPMSGSASGFVPAAGAGILIIEDYEHALKRNVNIYAEIIGSAINSGGQKNGGTMTFPNSDAVQRCIKSAIDSANITGKNIDLICGHLTGTIADKSEINNWVDALQLKQNRPYINSLKSLTGHMIGAAGAAETIAAVLQLKNNFIHQNLNCDDLHPEIETAWDAKKIPQSYLENIKLNYIIKAGFGFGDVNSCLVIKKQS